MPGAACIMEKIGCQWKLKLFLILFVTALCTMKEQSKERKEFGGRNYELVLSDYNHISDVRIDPV